MTDEQRKCAHEADPAKDVCRKCGLSARAFLMGDRPETAWVGMLDSVRFGPDSVRFGPDSVRFGPDSVRFGPDAMRALARFAPHPPIPETKDTTK